MINAVAPALNNMNQRRAVDVQKSHDLRHSEGHFDSQSTRASSRRTLITGSSVMDRDECRAGVTARYEFREVTANGVVCG